MNWYAVYTKPKSEEIVSQKLRQTGIEVYNPKLRLKKYIRNQYREVIEPLFPCYIFGRFETEKYHWMITYTRGVKKIIGDKTNPLSRTRWFYKHEIRRYQGGRYSEDC